MNLLTVEGISKSFGDKNVIGVFELMCYNTIALLDKGGVLFG